MQFFVTPHPEGKGTSLLEGPVSFFLPAFDFILEILEDAWNAHHYRDSMVMSKLDDLAWMDFACEDGSTFEKHRHEQPEGLAEHVTERQEVQNAYRLEWPRPLPVLRNLILKWTQVRANVAMTMNDAFRFPGRARRVNNLDHIIRSDRSHCERARRQLRDFVERCIVYD